MPTISPPCVADVRATDDDAAPAPAVGKETPNPADAAPSPVAAAPAANANEANRLVRVRSDVGVSLGERIARHFYRLTWRTPLHTLRLRGRYPLKLLAVPADAISGDPAAGAAILAGALVRRGEHAAIADDRFPSAGLSAAMVDHVQSFDWLRDLAAAAPRAQAAPCSEALTRAWIAAHGEKVSEPAWRPEIAARRILNWATHAPLILSSTDLVYRSAVLSALARTARHLDRTADRAEPGLPQITAWIGVVAAGLLIAGGKPRLAFGEAGLESALAAGLAADGGITCRAPQAQAQLIIRLAMLRNIYEARRIDWPIALETALESAVPPLLTLRLGDGGLSSWQGSLPLAASAVEAIIAGSRVRRRPLHQSREWGYQRIAAGKTIIVTDAAPPPTSRLVGSAGSGGCASTFAFEMSDGPERLIVNCGGASGGGTLIGAALAEGLRTTAAHSTLIVADSNSTAILSDGALGKGVTEVELDRQEIGGSIRIEARHDGYSQRFGLIHRRTMVLSADGREVRGEDVLLPAEKRKKRATHAFAVRFHLAFGVEATLTADSQGAILRLPSGRLWQFRARGGMLSIDDSVWIDGEGRPCPTAQIVIAGEAPPGGATVGWALKRAT